jgi:protein-disulfide isomerase
LIVGVSSSWIGNLGLEANAMASVIKKTKSVSQYSIIGSANLSDRRYSFDTSDSPSVGRADALVEMIVFGDYNCGHCHNFEPIILKLRQQFPEQLRVVFKFFPLDASCNPLLNSQQISTSCRAAKAAYAAHQQNLFEPYHRLLFEHFRDHSILRIIANAKQLGIDGKEEEQFVSIMKSEAALAHIRRDIAEAADSGLRGTPTVFLNGFKYIDNGTDDVSTRYQRLRKEIQELLQRSR